MRIAMIGTGYVGLVSGACFADFGHQVTCVDKDESKIAALRRGEIPIFEPGLDVLVAANVKAKRLDFSTNLKAPVAEADAVFIAVGTPSRRGDGHADLSYVYAAAREIAEALEGFTVVVTKSTVPVGTGDRIAEILAEELGLETYERETKGVRDLLYRRAALDRAFLERVAEAKKISVEELLQFEGQPIQVLRSRAVCGGLFFRLNPSSMTGDAGRAEAPMAFQSALAGILLAAELVIDAGSLRQVGIPPVSRIDLRRPLATHLLIPQQPAPNIVDSTVDRVGAIGVGGDLRTLFVIQSLPPFVSGTTWSRVRVILGSRLPQRRHV